ncbi:MAG: hypothetical protein ACIAQZ_16730 [Sedimentisphaeraceae bacterium JB056]
MIDTFKEWFNGGIGFLKKYYKWYLLVAVICTAINWLLQLFVTTENPLIIMMINVAGLVFVSALYYGLYRLSITGSLDMSYWNHFFSIIPELLIATAVFITLAFLGMILFIIPGIIVMTSFMFFQYLMLEFDIRIQDAFIYSKMITQGKRIPLFLVILLSTLASGLEVLFFIGYNAPDQVTQNFRLATGILYIATTFLIQPLSLAVLIYAYSQLRSKLATEKAKNQPAE